MHALVLSLWVSALGSFSWGVFRFFDTPSGCRRRTAGVAMIGGVAAAWDGLVVAMSVTPVGFQLAGAVFFVVSLVLFWWAVRACESQPLTAIFQDDLPVRLVRRGPYRVIRHPFYASYIIFWFGSAVTSLSIVALAAVIVMFCVYRLAIHCEERKFSASELAAEYAEYRREVGSIWVLLPAMRRLLTSVRAYLTTRRAA